ncbi:MAG: sulfite reductase subunit alpha [Betaproteobacteria bacterium]
MLSLLPETAPFSVDQRAWLNGFFAGLLGLEQSSAAPALPETAAEEDIDQPWHDPAMSLEERMKLAEGKPVKWQMMAAMAQLDCGQCGYLCQTYAAELASGAEKNAARCVPGGKPTTKMLKLLLEKSPPPASQTPASAGIAGQNAMETGYSAGVSSENTSNPSRDHPAAAKLLSVAPLHTGESDKPVNHIALSLENTGITYRPGDSLGVWPTNNPDEVELILSILKTRGSKSVNLNGVVMNARDALTRRVNLREPAAPLFTLMAEHAQLEFEATRLAKLAEDDDRVAEYGIHDVFDVLVKFRSSRPPIGPFLNALTPLQPRLYSIASSLAAHPGEVHLTVGLVRYDLNGRGYHGVASNFFAEHLQAGRRVPVYIQPSHGFQLPADAAKPVIMVGPGTGIAPFRAFLEERAAVAAGGKNWLFFGAQHEASDFLYREELENFRSNGALSKLTIAFSRDQSQKIYVQHRMLEHAAEIWSWLAEGAYFYVCGDAKRMAADVDAALKEIAVEQGGMDAAAAIAFVRQLAKEGRYCRDVY